MKNSGIIGKIPNGDKAEILKDVFAMPDLSGFGVPLIKCATLEEVNAQCGTYPDFIALSNTWNCDIMCRISQDLTVRAMTDGANLIITPDMRLNANPYKTGLTEDCFLGSAYLYAVASSIKNAGATACVSGCCLDGQDIKYLDKAPDKRTMNDYFYSPFQCIASFSGSVVVLTSHAQLEGGYKTVNEQNFKSLARAVVGANGFVLSSGNDGKVILDGTQNNLTNEEPDEAVDKVIEFAEFCNAEKPVNLKPVDSAELAYRAAEESVVLLKNENSALPLSENTRICVIGNPCVNAEFKDLFLKLLQESKYFTFTGFAQGYKADGSSDYGLTEEAAELAQKADAALLFLGTQETNGSADRLKLAANALALIAALKKSNSKIIAILPPDLRADTSFDDGVNALLLATINCRCGGEALLDILSGKKSPSGKLAKTLYEDTDEIFSKLKSDISSGRIKTGVFIGYRRYETERVKIKYPFGHGLSYAAFEYSDLLINGETVEITVKNTGSMPAAEVVQLYAGKVKSNVLRPFKELKSFAKVYLNAGESKTVCLKLRPSQFAVYNAATGKRVIEEGGYRIYAGSSVSDIRLEAETYVQGTVLKAGGESKSEYLQSESNVIEKGYTLGPVRRTEDKFKLLRTVSLAVLLAALVGGVVLGFLFALGITSLSYSVGAKASFGLVLSLCAVSLIVYFVSVGLLNNSKKDAPVIAPAKSVKGVQPTESFEKLFEDSFDSSDAPSGAEEKEERIPDGEQEILKHLDGSLDFKAVCAEFSYFSAERGISINASSVRRLFSSLCTSRFILLKTDAKLAPKFLNVLSEYFASSYCLDSSPKDLNGVFFAETQQEPAVSNTAKAVAAAMNKKHAVQIAGFVQVGLKEAGAAFSPFERYLRNPSSVSVKNKFTVPENLWLMPVLTDNSALKDADEFTAKEGCLLDISISPSEEKPEKSPVREVSYYQLEKMADAARRTYCLDEEISWKKIDKFEKLLYEHEPFRLDNKTCQRLETYSAVYLACGGEEREALDSAVAAKLMLPAAAVCGDINSRKANSLAKILASAFGEDMPECKKLLKYPGGNAEK